MNTLLKAIKWDVFLIYKYGIVAVAFAIALIYSLVFLLVDTEGFEKLIVALVFSDPVMYGFLFTAVIILFEKDANTHQVLAVTPLTTSQYILSKTIVFSMLALVTGSGIMVAAWPEYFNLLWFFLAVVLSAALFVFVGVVGVSYVNSFNEFILIIPLVLAPVCLPFLPFFVLADSWLFYLIPTQASLLLFEASVSKIENWQLIYALLYLLVLNYLVYRWAYASYNKRIIKTDRL
ncbi:MAG: ABC transporter permease [Salinivirgaceae bacterium]